jgi:phage terminase large subunit-like protein
LNPSAILFDELHAQPTADVWGVMESALGARFNPLLSAITTAGYILDGICTEIRKYLISILEGKRKDDSFFGYIYTLDEGDDPLDPANWPKANPGLGTSKRWDYMHTMARKAAALPSALVNFLTKDLNVWCGSPDGWLSIAVWDKGGAKFDPETLKGRKCFGGLDLSATRDLTAFSLVFPPNEVGGEWYVLVWFWCPQDKIDNQEGDDAAPYKRWQKDGWLVGTEGSVVDLRPVSSKSCRRCRTTTLSRSATTSGTRCRRSTRCSIRMRRWSRSSKTPAACIQAASASKSSCLAASCGTTQTRCCARARTT